jgi:hypothetical protein
LQLGQLALNLGRALSAEGLDPPLDEQLHGGHRIAEGAL